MADGRSRPGAWSLAALLLFTAAVGLVLHLNGTPPAVVAASAAPDVFSAARALEDVRGLTASGLPHPIGSEDHARARAFVEGRLRSLGLEPTLQRANACTERGSCGDVENIVAVIEGEAPRPALMLAAHYDSVPKGPGASDDGAGVATILEIVRALREGPKPRYSVVILIDDGEERGLLGARAFVDAHPLAEDVSVVLNFEARGSAGQTAMFETSAGGRWLIDAFAGAAEEPAASSVIYALYKKLPNDTDLTIFKKAGKQGLNFAFADRVWDYHTANDTAERMDPRSLQHMGDQGLAVTRALLAGDLATPAGTEAVYFDLFSRTLVVYGSSFARMVAGLALLFSALGISLAIRKGKVALIDVGHGLRIALTGVLAAAVLGIAVAALIGAVLGGLSPWGSGPIPPWSALVAAAVLASAGLGIRLSSKKLDASAERLPWGLFGGVVFLWAFLTALLAWKEVGASYLFAWPSLVMGGALTWLAWRGDASSKGEELALPMAGFVVAGLLWLPIVRVLLVMVGAGASPATTLPIALLVTTALPVVVVLTPKIRRLVPMFAAAALVVALVLALLRVSA